MTRDLLLGLFRAGLRAADPALVLPPHLPEPQARGRIVVLGQPFSVTVVFGWRAAVPPVTYRPVMALR